MSDAVPAGGTPITPGEWQSRVATLRTLLTEGGLGPEEVAADLRAVLESITFRSADERSWLHDGDGWRCWDGSRWLPALPPPQLRLHRVMFEEVPEPPDEPSLGVFAPTHLVPSAGLAAWDVPDPSREPVATLDPSLAVEVTEQRADGWAFVTCSNGWTCWLDGRRLVPLPPA